MAFPIVQSESGGHDDSDVNIHTITLPSGIVSGDLIIVYLTLDGSNSGATWPAGWTALLSEAGSGYTSSARFRRADGTEGASIDVTGTASDNEESAWTCYRISGHHASTDPESGAATGATGDPDPPSLDPTGWATEDTLWLAFCSMNGIDGNEPRVTGYPTNYTNGREDRAPGGNGVVGGAARRENAVGAEDPGTFAHSGGNTAWRGVTIAVRPAAAAAATPPKPAIVMNAVHRSFSW